MIIDKLKLRVFLFIKIKSMKIFLIFLEGSFVGNWLFFGDFAQVYFYFILENVIIEGKNDFG